MITRMFSTSWRRGAVRYLVHRMKKDGRLLVQFAQNRDFDYAIDDSVKGKTLYTGIQHPGGLSIR